MMLTVIVQLDSIPIFVRHTPCQKYVIDKQLVVSNFGGFFDFDFAINEKHLLISESLESCSNQSKYNENRKWARHQVHQNEQREYEHHDFVSCTHEAKNP